MLSLVDESVNALLQGVYVGSGIDGSHLVFSGNVNPGLWVFMLTVAIIQSADFNLCMCIALQLLKCIPCQNYAFP